MRILLTEDNGELVVTLEKGLREEGIDVVSLGSGAATLARIGRSDIDLVILDLGLPDRDGVDVLRELRRREPQMPVLVLTARDAVESRVQALDLGADDYLLKPFEFTELLARIRALTRRASGPRWSPRIEGVVLDEEHTVQVGGRRIPLSPRQYAFLAYLLRRHGEVVPRMDILREVFGYTIEPGTNAIDVHLAHLRRKLAGTCVVFETVRGAGFRVRVEA